MLPVMAMRLVLCCLVNGVVLVLSGPADINIRFTNEPSGRLQFANTVGAKLSCAASGTPKPVTSWTLTDGSPVGVVSGLREVGAAGELVFRPFTADRYRPDVHAAVYRCTASSSVGTIYSRDVNVYGIVVQSYDAQVYDSYVMEGNTAVLKCHVPTVVGDHLTVVAWIKNDTQEIISSFTAKGADSEKYAVLPTGDLHVRNVTTTESGSKYKCKTRHDLTGDVQVSTTAGSLFVTEPRGTMRARILEGSQKVEVKVGGNVTLACISQGNPSPSLSWFVKNQQGDQLPIVSGANYTVTSSYLQIRKLRPDNGEKYVCEAANELGKDILEMTVVVHELVTVTLRPKVSLVKVGENVTFQCDATGPAALTFSWLHDGRPVKGASGQEHRLSPVRISDQGVYQCVVRSDKVSEHAEAEIRLSEIQPYFQETFTETVVTPGSQLTLKCSASGIPRPIFQWLLDEVPVTANVSRLRVSTRVAKNGTTVSSLHIGKVVVSDGGVYACSAFNLGGLSRHVARVNVPGKLTGREIKNITAVSGSSVYLNCPFYGHPVTEITWSKDGNKPLLASRNLRFSAYNNGSLLMRDAQPSDGGVYQCAIRNSIGQTAVGRVELKVIVPPKIIAFNFLDDQFYKGMRAHVTCAVSQGDKPLTFEWLKDGRPLPPGAGIVARKYDEHTDSLSIETVGSSHSGNYSCVARNQAGAASHTAQLLVRVPPKIVPFSFQEEHLVEGQLARVSCTVSRGDLPLTLSWEKDRVELTSNLEGVQIRSIDEYSSSLSIARVSWQNNGVYTCVAANEAGTARHSTKLIANVPPKWITEPQDLSATVGSQVALHCNADGYPKPVIDWSFAKAFENLLLDPINIKEIGQAYVAPNGTLYFDRLESTNEGFYICSASNGIGRKLEAVIQVKINAPPRFKKLLTDVRISLKKNVQLQCDVEGNRPLNVSWWKDGIAIQFEGPRVTEQTVNHTYSVLSTLTVHNIFRNDSGRYICNATNIYGVNFTTAEIVVLEPPDAPSDLKAAAQASTTIELLWKPAYDGNDPIKKYVIQYKTESDPWEKAVTMETVNGMPTNSIIAQLQPATSYLLRVFGENGQGRSAASKILTATTEEDAPTGVPSDVQVESVNAETFRVTWKAPERKSWNGKLLGFYVGHKEVDVGEVYLFKSLLTPVSRADETLVVEIGELRQFTKYAVVVQMYNSRGKGPLSEAVVAMTSEGVPSQPPSNVRCTTLTSHSIHVTWTAPPVDTINGILRGYKVSYRPAADWFEEMADSFNVSLPTSLTLTHLNKFSNYSIQVQSMTKMGDGPTSSYIFCKTLDDAPEAPSDIKAAALSRDAVIVSWKPPGNPNGMLKSYSVYWKDAENGKGVSVNSVPSLSTTQEVSGLKEGTQYDFWVTASTMAGEGLSSRVVRQSPIGPQVPAKIMSFDEKIITAWQLDVTLACHSVGVPKPEIKWIHKEATIENGEKTLVSSDGTLSVKNVLEEDAGDYVCVSTNELNEDRITYTVTVLAPPSAPKTELASTSSSSIDVLWTPPASSKLSKIKGYTVHYRKDIGEWQEVTLGATAVGHRLENLDCGTRYEVYVTPFNKIGIGAPSEILVAATNGSVPAAPLKEDLMEEASNSVSLYLNTWKSNGCPVLHFTVEYSPRSISEWSLVSDNVKPEQRRLVVPGLRPATWYGLRMTASNGAGSTVAEYTFATLTNAGATVLPELQSDAAAEEMEGLLAYLNFYMIVPATCMIVVLLAIMGAACFYLKIKKREQQSDRANRASTVSASLMHGTRSGSFSYVQRATLGRGTNHSRLQEDELSPYATFHLANRRGDTLGRHSNVAPPLPPPRMFDSYPQDSCLPMNPNYSPAGNGFLPSHGPVETTFIFPRHPSDDHAQHCMANFPQRSYPVDESNSKFA